MSHPVYLLRGERFLVDEALERVRRETDADPLSEISFDAPVDPSALLNALETPSLLGGKRLVMVRDANDLKKEQIDAVALYLGAPSPHAVLVLVATGKTKLDDVAKNAGALISLDAPKGRALLGWVRERARARGMKLDDPAARALVDSVGSELRELDGALSQLETGSGAGARLTVAEVRRHFPRLADERTFALTDAVGDRRLAEAMTLLRRLLQQDEHPLMLLGALSGQVRRMLRARRYAERGAQAVADALGLPSWRAERLARQARSYREEELVRAMAILAATDVEMKGGDLPAEAALERAVLEIVLPSQMRVWGGV